MGYNSQSGQVILRSQTTPGTPMADLGTAGIATRLRSGSMAINREFITLDPEIGGGRDTADAYLGPANYTGEYELYPRFESLATLLRGALGEVASTEAGGVNTHVFTPTEGQLPYLTVYEEISTELERFLYHDVVVNTLHFEADASGVLQGTAGMIARHQQTGVPDIDGSGIYDNTQTAVGTSVTILYNGLQLPAKSFGFDLTNNIEDDDYRLGQFPVGDLTAKQREVTGSFTIRHDNAALMRQATLGSPTATTVGGLTTKSPLTIRMNAYQMIDGATPPTPYGLTLTFPNVILEPFAFEPSGDDLLENDISWRAVRPDPMVPVMTATLKNGSATIA